MFKRSGSKSQSNEAKATAEKMERDRIAKENAETAEKEAEIKKLEEAKKEIERIETEKLAADNKAADEGSKDPEGWVKARALRKLSRIDDGSIILPGTIFSGKLSEIRKYGKAVDILDKKNRMMGAVITK